MKTPEQEPIDFELAYGGIYKDQRAALAEALAQPEQEPVAWVKYARKKPEVKALSWQEYPTASEIAKGFVSEPLYRNPPKREWVGLTDEDRDGFNLLPTVTRKDFVAFARYVEMLSKEKNQ